MRYLAMAISTFIMVIATFLQTCFALLPFLAMGFLLSITVIYSFVVAVEKQLFRQKILETELREKQKQEELDYSRHLTNTDPLTGVNSRYAYVEKEEAIDLAIRDGNIDDFAIVVFDLNNLKAINDTFGHEAGDKYIIRSTKLMQKYFPDSPLFRFGGDEFVIILQGENFTRREELLKAFDENIESSRDFGKPIIATGLSTFEKGKDNTFRAVFMRADNAMYIRKAELKAKH